MKSLNSYFEYALKKSASDLHLVADAAPIVRIHGQLAQIEEKTLPPGDLAKAIDELLSSEQSKFFKDNYELDFSLAIAGARFRVNLHQQSGKVGLAARLIPKEIPSADDLRLEEAIREIPKLSDGLVLVTGPSGCGKSTTLASLIEVINQARPEHIVTIEDPIEFVFENKKSLIEQREVGADTKSFYEALKRVLRQDPDIILVGEMRDPETIGAALTAAETGHLVLSTLHTPSAAEAVERIVGIFEGFKQKQVLVQLAGVLRVVVAQQLLPSKTGKLVAAREILINTPAVGNLIRENKIAQIKSAIQTSARQGMITLDNSLKNLAKEGLI